MNEQHAPAEHHRRIWAIAERRPRRAVALAQQLCQRTADGALAERAWAAFSYGFALLSWERFGPARAQLDAALALFAQLPHQDGQLRTRRLLLTIDHLSGVGLRLQDDWRALVADHTAAGDALGAARVQMDQAAHLNVLARPDEALQLVAAASPQIEAAGTTAERARLLRLAAIANTSASRFAQAEQQLEATIELYRSERLMIDVAKCLMQRGWLNVRLERLGPARADLSRASHVFHYHKLALSEAVCFKDLGLLDLQSGYYRRAMEVMVRARKGFSALERVDLIDRCDFHIAVELGLLLEHATDPARRRLLYLDTMHLAQPDLPPWRDLETLSQLLLPAAVREALRPERRLLIVPAGQLHALPWAALRLEGAWLCERCIPQLLQAWASG